MKSARFVNVCIYAFYSDSVCMYEDLSPFKTLRLCMYVRWDRINKGIAASHCGVGKVRGGSNALVFAGIEERFQK